MTFLGVYSHARLDFEPPYYPDEVARLCLGNHQSASTTKLAESPISRSTSKVMMSLRLDPRFRKAGDCKEDVLVTLAANTLV